MGQQQLLLVILVTILVGIATVVAINTFGSSNVNANRDAVRNDIAAIASSAQAWYIKPGMLGGGNNSFATITFDAINVPADSIYNSGLSAANLNGAYVLSARTDSSVTVTATPTSTVSAETPFTFEGVISAGDLVLTEQ